MYINKLQWQGFLGKDCQRIEPRKEKDPVFVTFSVAQAMPGRVNGTTQENTVWLNCKARWSLERADSLTPKLLKGAHVFIEGALEIEEKDTATGRRTYINMVVSNVQFIPRPMRAEQETETEAPSSAPLKAEAANPSAFNPARFDED